MKMVMFHRLPEKKGDLYHRYAIEIVDLPMKNGDVP
jgi:hypothetical protein